MTAPVCPTSRSQDKNFTPRLVDEIMAIPIAHDLRTVITAINAINHVIQRITRGEPQINNTISAINIRESSQNPPEKLDYDKMTWREVRREWSDSGRVVNPDDQDQYVYIKIIKNIKWQDDLTGHQLVYMGHMGPIGPGRM